MRNVQALDLARERERPRLIAEFLNGAFKSDSPSAIISAIGALARDRGMSFVAKQAGVSREGLYRSFDGNMDPKFGTVIKVLKAFGVQIIIKPRRRRRPASAGQLPSNGSALTNSPRRT